MKPFRKLSLALVLSSMASPLVMGMENTTISAGLSTEPLTPRTMGNVTQRFQTITSELADENAKYVTGQQVVDIDMDPPVNPPVQKKIFSFDNEGEGTQVRGEFPTTTKMSEVLAILKRGPADTSLIVTPLYDSVVENLFVREITDAQKTWFIIAGFSLPLQKEPTPEDKGEAAVQIEPRPDIGKKVEELFQRARDNLRKIDLNAEGKRVENWAKDEARPKIEQEARNTGKALERAGQKVGRLFGRK